MHERIKVCTAEVSGAHEDIFTQVANEMLGNFPAWTSVSVACQKNAFEYLNYVGEPVTLLHVHALQRILFMCRESVSAS